MYVQNMRMTPMLQRSTSLPDGPVSSAVSTAGANTTKAQQQPHSRQANSAQRKCRDRGRTDIAWSTAHCGQVLHVLHTGQTEISDLDNCIRPRGVEQQILRLQIAVNNISLVQILNGLHDVFHEITSVGFREMSAVNDAVKKFTASDTNSQLGHEKNNPQVRSYSSITK